MAEIGVDLGTANTVVFDGEREHWVREPSRVVYEVRAARLVSLGAEARDMEGRIGERYRLVAPVQSGVVADFAGARALATRMITRIAGARRLFARVVAAIPGCATDVERKAVEEVMRGTGGRAVRLVPKALAAAWGAGLAVDGDRARMLVDIGAGTTEIAVFAFGETIAADSLKVGGEALDAAIAARIRARRHVVVGRPTAEKLKLALARVGAHEGRESVGTSGIDLTSGRPLRFEVDEALVGDAVRDGVEAIVTAIEDVVKRLPPDVCVDLAETGVTLAGGGSLLAGLRERIAERLEMPVRIAKDPHLCVARGIARASAIVPVRRG